MPFSGLTACFKPAPAQNKKPPFRTAFSFGGASGTLPGCAVSHCCAVFRRSHCSAALPNAPLRFLRRRRRSALHTQNPPRRVPNSSPPQRKTKSRPFGRLSLLVGHQGLYPVVPCRTAARSSAARIALRHCPMLRFAFSAAGGAQLCIPRTRPGGSRIQARPSAKQKAALSDGFFFWWGIRDLNPGPAGYEPDALTN